jgi:arylsulfatase A-like enzyme
VTTGRLHGRTRVRGNGAGIAQALRAEDVTVAKVLKDAGYRTALIGKWGLGDGAHVPDFGPYADKDWPDPDRGQAAMISRLDGYGGRMMAELRKLGLAEKTLVIFTSDNGPHNESNHNLARFNPSGPLTGIKRSLTDGGIRIPMIAWWPSKVKAGTESDHVGSFADWMATAAKLAGAKVPSGRDSISFVPTLLGKPESQAKHEFLYWEFHEGGFK